MGEGKEIPPPKSKEVQHGLEEEHSDWGKSNRMGGGGGGEEGRAGRCCGGGGTATVTRVACTGCPQL